MEELVLRIIDEEDRDIAEYQRLHRKYYGSEDRYVVHLHNLMMSKLKIILQALSKGSK
jgi:hypothetical protein